ncbi:hypothetical protein NHQ30_005847 [Ciborinia camelliae]|nr:hypothetical protein NHQ30_005847 [Ciborinia camelliae]
MAEDFHEEKEAYYANVDDSMVFAFEDDENCLDAPPDHDDTIKKDCDQNSDDLTEAESFIRNAVGLIIFEDVAGPWKDSQKEQEERSPKNAVIYGTCIGPVDQQD